MIQFKLEDDPVYAGSKLFAPLADKVGVPIDKLNFLIAQLAALLLAIIYRAYFSTKVKSDTVKYLAVLIPGFLLGYFEFGYQIWNLWTMGMVSYILICSCNPNIVQDVVLFVSIFYLSYLHLRRQLNSNGSYVVDITAPTMIAVQKITSLAYSVHDGMSNRKVLTQDQQRLSITQVPTLLQFFSYVFQFPTLLAGPMFYFNDFVGYIEGTTENEYLNRKEKRLPSYKLVALQKLFVAFFFMFLLLFVEPMFPISKIYDDKFLNESSVLGILFYIYLSTTCQRFKYYGAWKLGEAVTITSGFGLIKNDLDEFEYISSVDIIGFEFANNFRKCLSSWNITTQNWLRRVSYERSKSNKVAKTYVLSAVWHGFYPGYYLTFLSGGIFTSASRVARKYVRPHFQANRATRLAYDVITFFVTKLILTYIVFPFVILDFAPSLKIYSRLWFSGHVALILITVLPILLKGSGGQRERSSSKPKSN